MVSCPLTVKRIGQLTIYSVTYWCDFKYLKFDLRTEPFSFLFELWQN